MDFDLAIMPLIGPERDENALKEGPLTFRDHFISLYQSAVAEIARRIDGTPQAREAAESLATSTGWTLVLAAERIAQIRANNLVESHPGAAARKAESSGLEKMSPIDHAQTCASLGAQLLHARLSGDAASVEQLEAELRGSSCDPLWATTIEEYVKYFGPGGTRRAPLYIKPEEVGSNVITVKSNAKIALIGDWGTGAEPARRILQQVKAQNPDILIHLGDIYYSGTPEECDVNFEAIVNEVFDRSRTQLPVYTLAGNHDMYCGGVGYYDLIKRLNLSPMTQIASFFCLRTQDESWQLLAMDTGQHDYSPLSVTDVMTFVDSAEQEWHRQRIAEFDGKTILLSHHQLFSAFSQIGKPTPDGRLIAYNPKLRTSYDNLRGTGKAISAWFWGHEHNLCVYEPYIELKRGRCIGHSAIPVFVADTPYATLPAIDDPPDIVKNTTLSIDGQFYTHGFVMLTLGSNGLAEADYFEDLNGNVRKLFAEMLD